MKLLTLNIHKAKSVFGGDVAISDYRKHLSSLGLDFVCLQEVVGNEKQHEMLADQLWSHYAYAKNAASSRGHHGNCILSKYPIIVEDHLDLSVNKFEGRGLHIAKIEVDGVSIQILTTHLNLLSGDRVIQQSRIIDYCKTSVDLKLPTILAGDFNDWSVELSPIFWNELGLQDAFVEKNRMAAKTFPAFMPFLKLDRIYTKNIKILSARVLNGLPWSKISDHLPLLLEFGV